MKHIESKDNATIKWVKKLQTQRKARYADQRYVVENIAFIDGIVTQSPELVDQIIYDNSIELPSAWDHIPGGTFISSTRPIIKHLSAVGSPQGALAICKMPSFPPPLTHIQTGIILDQINDPSNLGAIIRSAVAFDVDHIFLTENSTDPYHPDSCRASAGLISQCAISILEKSDLDRLKSTHTFIALDAHANRSFGQIDTQSPVILIAGSEAHGISSPELQAPQLPVKAVTIPMKAGVESLNLAISVSIWLQHRYATKTAS